MKLFDRNNIFFGIVLALVVPFISYALLWLINHAIEVWINEGDAVLKHQTLVMAAILLNLVIFIPYLKLDRYERTGRGILLVTFVGVVFLFLLMFM